MSREPSAPVPNHRTFALIVLGSLAFTVYGSLVPFESRSRPWGEVTDAFVWAMANRWWPESRSDGVANVLLGVPLGFGLLGLVCVDRRSRLAAIGRGLLLLPACVGVAAGVEFVQLYFPARTCSGSDVLCQGLGSALGMTAWVLFGQRLTEHARAIWSGREIGGATGRLLVVYLVLLAFVQFLPMDLTASPKELYKKVRDQVVFVPFEEFRGRDTDQTWDRAARLLQVFGLYLPVGLLAAGLPGRFGLWGNPAQIVAAALGLAGAMEALQLIVQSRVPSATDVTIGAAGALAGWLIRLMRHRGLSPGDVLGYGSWWLLMLGAISWQPFRGTRQVQPFDWMPGLPLENGNPLFALEEMLTKLVLFSFGGVIIGTLDMPVKARSRLIGATVIGLSASAVFEAGQTVFVGHTPCITDVLLGGLGAFLGAWATSRVVTPAFSGGPNGSAASINPERT